jgi:hypothetical protein
MSDHLPSELIYHAIRFPVLRPSSDDAPTSASGLPVCGQYDGNNLRLIVRTGLAPAQAWATFFHEVAHHALEKAGDAHQENAEGLCDWFGWLMVDLLAQNPALQRRVLEDMAPVWVPE